LIHRVLWSGRWESNPRPKLGKRAIKVEARMRPKPPAHSGLFLVRRATKAIESTRLWRRRVEVENITDRNLKDLEEMLGSTKSLKRNNRKCKGILIGPLKAPRFLGAQIPSLCFISLPEIRRSASGQISRHGWQADHRTFPRNESQSEWLRPIYIPMCISFSGFSL
jgi:hypothetical protein